MSIFEDNILTTKINNYLNGELENPLLKKVIEEEFIYSSNIEEIIKNYLSDIIKSDKYTDKINYLNTLIKNVSKDNFNFLRDTICNSFVGLNPDEQIYFIINTDDNNKNIFEIMNNDNKTQNTFKNLITGLSLGIGDKYITKCIDACNVINKSISDSIVKEYLSANCIDITCNNQLLAYFIKYLLENPHIYCSELEPLLKVKFESINNVLNNLLLNNMDFAYEIYNIGKLIIDSCINFKNRYNYFSTINFSDEQLEYIIKAIHTCIINNNIPQAKTILAIVYLIDLSQLDKFMGFYNKFLQVRIKSTSSEALLSNEYELWNINNNYNKITSESFLSEYKQIINNIRYSIIINNDMGKIKIKNSSIEMNKINIKLENEINSNFQDMKHHPNIQEYINNLNKYFDVRTPLQYITHSMEKSKIKFQTNMGSITCSLVMGSILLYIKDTPLSITELVEKTNINEDNIRNKLDILCMNDIVICMEDGVQYKYIEPFGDVDCFDNFSNFKAKTEKQIVINRFTDIIMTIESRIIKEIKPNKMNIMELERRVQEYVGESYIRSIFYQRIESLKKRYLIEEKDSIIEYSV